MTRRIGVAVVVGGDGEVGRAEPSPAVDGPQGRPRDDLDAARPVPAVFPAVTGLVCEVRIDPQPRAVAHHPPCSRNRQQDHHHTE
jgi:hypothetical protein